MSAVFSKEFRSYFNSPIAYIFMAVFIIISGIFFVLSDIIPGSADYSPVLDSLTFLFVLLVPMLTMRSLAEEKNQKTDQLLLTSPLKLYEIVLGKYLAAVSIFLITLCVTLLFPVILSFFGKIGVAEIMCYYIGFALMGSSLIAIGIFISSLTENQVTSAIGTIGALLVLWLLDPLQQNFPASTSSSLIFAIFLVIIVAAIVYGATRNIYLSGIIAIIGVAGLVISYIAKSTIYDGFAANFISWFSILKRYDNFAMGLLDVSSIIYYVSFSAVFIFLAIRILERRKWS